VGDRPEWVGLAWSARRDDDNCLSKSPLRRQKKWCDPACQGADQLHVKHCFAVPDCQIAGFSRRLGVEYNPPSSGGPFGLGGSPQIDSGDDAKAPGLIRLFATDETRSTEQNAQSARGKGLGTAKDEGGVEHRLSHDV
jgi:hypothetical protein